MAPSHQIPSERDIELLSAYLDGDLPDPQRTALEQRLQSDPALRTTLNELRDTVGLLRDLPRLKAPRNFTLDPQQYSRPLPWWQRLFSMGFALEMSGAIGAAASVVLIVLALLSGGSANEERQATFNAADSDTVALQPSPLPGEQRTATALAVDDARTEIAYAGDDLIQTTIAAQSTHYAGILQPAPSLMLPTGTPLPTRTVEPVPIEAETNTEESMAAMSDMAGAEPESAASNPVEDTQALPGAAEAAPYDQYDQFEAGAPPPQVEAMMTTATMSPPVMEAPSAPQTALEAEADDAADEGGIGTDQSAGAAMQQAMREAAETTELREESAAQDNGSAAFAPTTSPSEADGESQAMTEPPLETQTKRVAEADTDETPWWLAGLGAALFVVSIGLFIYGRRSGRRS